MPPTSARAERLAFLALLSMAAAWGSTFFLLRDLVDRLPVTDLLAVRFGVASVALAVLAGPRLRISRRTLRAGVLLGLLYGVAQILQTVGLQHTSASVSGFVTGLYVVATPLLAAVLLRVRVAATTWLAAGLATVGLGVLSLQGFAVGYGELLTLVSAVVYAGHILALGRLAGPDEALGLSLVQLVVVAVLCGAVAAWPSGGSGWGITLPGSLGDWLAVGYLAVVAGALTMVLQTWAQARIDASRAAVLMALEPVWAALFAVTLGDDQVTVRMVVGGAAILAAMYLVELAPGRTRTAEPAPAASRE